MTLSRARGLEGDGDAPPSPATPPFLCAAGSIVGREHVRLHRNNQDGVALRREDGVFVAVVTDGCSSGRYNEVGARLAAALLAARAPALRRANADDDHFAASLADTLLASLAPLADAIPPPERAAFVRDHLLFTFLCVVVDERARRVVVVGIGDGVLVVDGVVRVLSAGADNAPPYLGYRLVAPSALDCAVPSVAPVVHLRASIDDVATLMIATDGAAEIVELLPAIATDARHVAHPTVLHKRLVVLGDVDRRLRDDTTCVLLRRDPAPTQDLPRDDSLTHEAAPWTS